MKPARLAHIGLLVADLEMTREHWMTVLNMPFSPISRYRPMNWSDKRDPEPHLSDARLTFCFGDDPSIEVIEFTGRGTHSPTKGEGGHHIAFPPVADAGAMKNAYEALGIGTDGTIDQDGRLIFMFTDPAASNNVFTEWVEEHPGHADVKDDLSPVDRMPNGDKTLFPVDLMLSVDGIRPRLRMPEIRIAVADLQGAVKRWSELVGYDFAQGEPLGPHSTAIGTMAGGNTVIRLVEGGDPRRKEGLYEAVFLVDDLDAEHARLCDAGVPLTEVERERQIVVDRSYLAEFSAILRQV